jgi:hypothetical protein
MDQSRLFLATAAAQPYQMNALRFYRLNSRDVCFVINPHTTRVAPRWRISFVKSEPPRNLFVAFVVKLVVDGASAEGL